MNGINKATIKGRSIKIRVAYALFALVVVQGLILLCSIAATGALKRNDIATYDILSNQSSSMRNELQKILNTNRKNLTNASLELSAGIETTLSDNHITIDMLDSEVQAYNEILDLSFTRLAEFTKYSSVTGVFVILDTASDVSAQDKENRVCMYLRDSSPGVVSGDNGDLMLEYGYADIARKKGIGLDYLWRRDMSFSKGRYRDFYFKPLSAVPESGADISRPQAYGYWSPPFILRKDDVPVITYSLPLILSDGTVYGVMGLELQTNYISNLQKATEIPYDNGFYLMCADVGDGIYNDTAISSGAYANQFLSGGRVRLDGSLIYEGEGSRVYEVTSPNNPGRKAIGAYSGIDLYETHSTFYNEKWTLICMAPKNSVLAGSDSVKNAIFISITGTIFLALILSLFVTFYITRPINRFSETVRGINPKRLVRFERTGVLEIDGLSEAFEFLSDGVSEAAGRMFKIVELVDMPLGSFEINYEEGSVRLSESLFPLLNMEAPEDGSFTISTAVWDDFIQTLDQEYSTKNDDSITETLYSSSGRRDVKRWLRMRIVRENTRDIGVLIDITDEMLQKQRLEFERNYDSLTKLLNRQAFMNKSSELLQLESDKVGIMMFADLDDLKFVNDSYGHEVGDSYIRAFAGFLNKFSEIGAVTGRISGDEFTMFMCGFGSREEAKSTFDVVFSELSDTFINVQDGLEHKLRVSVGISYYPSDSYDIDELVKYADYAMYEIKHSIKGEVKEFNVNDYNKNSFVMKMKDILNLLIDEKRIFFVFQPIIDVRTGEVFAYEALMRSMMKEFKSPSEILRIARSQSKLYQIEKLTFDILFDWLSGNLSKIDGKKIFINSIPGQIFSDNDMSQMRDTYNHLAENIVFEITESEFSSKEDTKKKVDSFRDFGSMIAIDDYGSGYSNDLALLIIEPEYLKIDMSIVRDIDKDFGKQQLVKNTIMYASKKKIRVIAEGVETYEELSKLISFGVDYIQGYYLSEPCMDLCDTPKDLKNKLVELSRGFSVTSPDD